jgi:protein-tyrosine phosphatase
MAEGIFKKELAEKIGLNLDELSEKGYKVISTGTCGMTGVPPSREAVVACLKKGVDISEHLSCGLKREHIEESSLIFVMSERHRDAVLNICPKAGNKTFLLAGNRQIADPIGQTQQYYDKCCNMIEENIKRILSEIQL